METVKFLGSRSTMAALKSLVLVHNRRTTDHRISFLTLSNTVDEMKVLEISHPIKNTFGSFVDQEVFAQVVPEWAHSLDELDGLDRAGIDDLFEDYYLDEERPANKWLVDLKLVYVIHDWNDGTETTMAPEDYHEWLQDLMADVA